MANLMNINLPTNVLKKMGKKIILEEEEFLKICRIFRQEAKDGLNKDKSKRKSLQMENTFVRHLLDGTECGDYMGLDLGGTNFRVLLCKMRNGELKETKVKKYNLEKEVLRGPSDGVFDHIAESISKFVAEHNIQSTNIPLGFTFSFPMSQFGLNKGILVTWTKTFKCPDGVGKDAVKMLEDALKRKKITKIKVVAILNDTTGTLLAGSYLDHKCSIGLILGTGFNAAYVENAVNVKRWGNEEAGDTKQVVIDTECGAFGDNGSLDFFKSEEDFLLDKHSNHIGSFTFEKLFAGHYVGDLVRLHLKNLNSSGVFLSEPCEALRHWGHFNGSHVTNIERGHNVEEILENLLKVKVTKDDCIIARYICRAISIRCCQLVSVVILELARMMERSHVTVAIDGSWYRHHPKMKSDIEKILTEFDKNRTYDLILADDGSGKGAAFVASVATTRLGH